MCRLPRAGDVLVQAGSWSHDGLRGHPRPAPQAAALGVRHPVQEGSGEQSGIYEDN